MTCHRLFVALWAALLSAWEVRSLTHRIHFKKIIRTALEPYVVGQAVQDYETNNWNNQSFFADLPNKDIRSILFNPHDIPYECKSLS